MSRSPNFNFVAIAGYIVRDAEVKRVGDNGMAVTTITVANNQNYKDRDGNWQEAVNFVDVELWGNLAERSDNLAKKGTPVAIQGSIKENQWRDKDNKTHSRILIRAERVNFLTYPDKND